ncbi:hypothetical protein AAKU64_000195 [Undibacterium sp. GrIS 1.8]|uniref:hypothetical protein n=1 Tax=Undibacterium sp. GrIS 1.8 TaxID=3143934 RepID=UPI00339A9E08
MIPSIAIKPKNLAAVAEQIIAPAKLPPTEQLLREGGDARIAIAVGQDEDGVSNKYGCQSSPNDALLAYGSSTASTISTHAFLAANGLRQRLLAALNTETPQNIYQYELNRVRQELNHLCELDKVSGTDLIFAASGTDLHLIAAQLVAQRARQNKETNKEKNKEKSEDLSKAASLLVIMMEAEETGSGVPMAVAGRHFSSRSALGESVTVGANIIANAVTDAVVETEAQIEVVTVAIRLSDGTPRAIDEVDAEVASLANHAATRGQQVLLTLVDVTKTGMIAPSIACAQQLSRRLPDTVTVLVDACQFRLSNASLHGYLLHHFMVALTGSKFLTGPTFSGVLMIPPEIAQSLRRISMPPALRTYSCRADWPQDWAAADALAHVANFGLLLRWEAALEELRAFRAVPETAIVQFLEQFSAAFADYLEKHPELQSVPVPRLDRQALNGETSWDQYKTIFPFLLCASATPDHRDHPTLLSREQTMQVYRLLLPDLSGRSDLGFGDVLGGEFLEEFGKVVALQCQLGQPVLCGQRAGLPVSALRLCASARLIVEATANHGQQASQVIAKALAVLDKTIVLIQHVSQRS